MKRVVIEQDKNLALGNVVVGADAIMLKGAVVTAMAQKVTLKEDTFVYNSAAYRTPEGSVVEELVKRLPGAEVSDDGTIKINGKEVKKILVDGKEFMTGDTKTALKNLPTSIIDKIKAYDEKSDLSKVTGIDDGEEQTVLDFNVKKGMNKGLMSNIDLGIGNKDRYSARGMGGYFNSNNRFMLFGNANNTSDRGFGGGGLRRGFGGLALAACHAKDHVAIDILIGEGGVGLVVHDDDVRRGPGLQNAQRVGEVLLADLGVVLEEHIRDLAPADVGQAVLAPLGAEGHLEGFQHIVGVGVGAHAQ